MLESNSDTHRIDAAIGLWAFGGFTSCAGSLPFLFPLAPLREHLFHLVRLPLPGELSLQGESSIPAVELSFVAGAVSTVCNDLRRSDVFCSQRRFFAFEEAGADHTRNEGAGQRLTGASG